MFLNSFWLVQVKAFIPPLISFILSLSCRYLSYPLFFKFFFFHPHFFLPVVFFFFFFFCFVLMVLLRLLLVLLLVLLALQYLCLQTHYTRCFMQYIPPDPRMHI